MGVNADTETTENTTMADDAATNVSPPAREEVFYLNPPADDVNPLGIEGGKLHAKVV